MSLVSVRTTATKGAASKPRRLILALVLLIVGMAAASIPKSAQAQPSGIVCPTYEILSSPGPTDFNSRGLELNLSTGICQTYQSIFSYNNNGGTDRLVFFLDGDGASIVNAPPGFSVSYGSNISGVLLNGSPYASGDVILVDQSGSFSGTFQFDYGGSTFNFDIMKPAGLDAINGFAVRAGPVILTSGTNASHAIANFLSRRADQITANDPDLAQRLMNGGNANAGSNGNAVSFSANGDLENNQVAMSTSLRQMARANRVNQDKRHEELPGMMGLGSKPIIDPIDTNGFDAWVQGKWVRVDGDFADSDLGLLYVGADYRVNSSLLLGVLAQFDWTDEDYDASGLDIDGRGWMVGPYMVARIHQNLIFDTRAAWGQSDNDISPTGTYTDSFDTDRWLVKGQLTGDLHYGRWHFTPHVGIIYFEEDQKAYTDSNGIDIGSQKISLGRVTFGPKVSTNFDAGGDLVVSPYLGIKGIWDFDEAETVDVATGLASGSDDLRGRVEGGMTFSTLWGLSLSGEGFYDGIGASDFDAYGGSAKINIPLN